MNCARNTPLAVGLSIVIGFIGGAIVFQRQYIPQKVGQSVGDQVINEQSYALVRFPIDQQGSSSSTASGLRVALDEAPYWMQPPNPVDRREAYHPTHMLKIEWATSSALVTADVFTALDRYKSSSIQNRKKFVDFFGDAVLQRLGIVKQGSSYDYGNWSLITFSASYNEGYVEPSYPITILLSPDRSKAVAIPPITEISGDKISYETVFASKRFMDETAIIPVDFDNQIELSTISDRIGRVGAGDTQSGYLLYPIGMMDRFPGCHPQELCAPLLRAYPDLSVATTTQEGFIIYGDGRSEQANSYLEVFPDGFVYKVTGGDFSNTKQLTPAQYIPVGACNRAKSNTAELKSLIPTLKKAKFDGTDVYTFQKSDDPRLLSMLDLSASDEMRGTVPPEKNELIPPAFIAAGAFGTPVLYVQPRYCGE